MAKRTLIFFGLLFAAMPLVAQLPVTSVPDQEALLQSDDPQLAHNKRFVYDFWREVLEGRHVELAEKYMSEGYIQHNPNVPTGRAAFVGFFGRLEPLPIVPEIKGQVVSITAEGDLVTLAFVDEHPDPADETKTYTTTWFDMFRLEDGKIIEHWDSALIGTPLRN